MTTGSFHGGRTTGALALSLQGHELRHQRAHVVGRVLAVEQQPVEARQAEHLAVAGLRASTSSR